MNAIMERWVQTCRHELFALRCGLAIVAMIVGTAAGVTTIIQNVAPPESSVVVHIVQDPAPRTGLLAALRGVLGSPVGK